MENILDNFQIDLEYTNDSDQKSILIFLGGLTQNSLEPLELEVAAKICSKIYINLYGNDFTNYQHLLENYNNVVIDSFKLNVRNRSLWQAIWIYTIKNFKILPSKSTITNLNNHEDLLLWCINYILNNLKLLEQNSLYLLRTLQLILKRTDLLTHSLSLQILNCMSNISLSPLAGFKQLAESVSKRAMIYIESVEQYKISDINLLPIKGISTEDIIQKYSDEFVKNNKVKIINKVLMMFSNNIENKDGGLLYEKLLICTFDEWISSVWPHFISKFQRIDYEGEFFQTLVKYWIPISINVYRTDFYQFIKEEPIDLQLKAYVMLESRRKGFLFEPSNIFNNNETINLHLKIISMYRKKTLSPGIIDVRFLLDFLYSNLKTYLEDEEVDSIRRFFSQMFFSAHNCLRKSGEHFQFYEDFVNLIYNYCYNCFYTDFFQVGAQVLHIFLSILKGSHKDLFLIYKLEKQDYYERGENRLYVKLKKENLWKFDDMYHHILYCFLKTKCFSLILTELLTTQYRNYNYLDVKIIKYVLEEVDNTPNLLNTEKIINCANLLFSQEKSVGIIEFVEEISGNLLNNLTIKTIDEINLFQNILYLEILILANRHRFEIKDTNEIIRICLETINFVLKNEFLKEINYRYIKVVETFITRIMFFLRPNLKDIWAALNKKFIIATLINIIKKSNMKKPVSVSTDILRHFGFLMEGNEHDKIFKINLLYETLDAINEAPITSSLKIRRNPESRLVIHSMCISQRNDDKPLLHWTMNYLMSLISDPQSTDVSISSSLHTIEILISDNRLQNETLQYIPDIIIQCVELFKRPNWIVRNADLQLAKSLIERLFGVSMNNFYRPKNISDIFILYENLAPHFFKILSLENLDDRAVLILQFFSESQVKENILNDCVEDIFDCFRVLFLDIIKTYENHYSKLAVKAYASLCLPKNIPDIFSNIENYITTNFVNLRKNILRNLVLLMQELYNKYKNSYENLVYTKGLNKIHFSWNRVLKIFTQFDSELFDYLLIKIKSVDDIIKEKKFKNNLWVHNNLTFLFLNASAEEICQVLNDEEFCEVPEFFQIKMLTILTQRYEQQKFLQGDLLNIYNCLLRKSIYANENNYLLNCYFKFFLSLQQFANVNFNISVSCSKNLYKNLLNLLYVDRSKSNPPESFFESVIQCFKSNIHINEEIDNDILSTLTISYSKFPQKCRPDICKIVFYLSLFKPTHLEAQNFISTALGKSFCNILEALTDFLSKDSLIEILENENDVKKFVNAVNVFLEEKESNCEDEFYEVETEKLVPKNIVKKIMRTNFG